MHFTKVILSMLFCTQFAACNKPESKNNLDLERSVEYSTQPKLNTNISSTKENSFNHLAKTSQVDHDTNYQDQINTLKQATERSRETTQIDNESNEISTEENPDSNFTQGSEEDAVQQAINAAKPALID